jgi:PAS domain S-box-containing protein
LRDGQGDIFGCIGLGIDVTEKVERELQYEQLLRQLRFGQHISRMGSWEIDIGTGKCVWSDEAYRLLGLEPEAVEPSYATFLDRVHPDDRDPLHDRYVEGARTGETYEVEYRVVRLDGAVRQMRGVVAFEHDPDGSLIRIAGILRDISPLAADRGSTARDVTARSIRDRPLTG